ncbi:HEAT repeat domain-containing protein [Chondromyces apiculatus]|uniref:HEAT repeat domain-containing protein n=1 Tax=Chondromyces apiculatus DSM 436 TaxID=1192034 RepID=A0A017SUJ9_9BACT|nr:HEAT repeat domain-containing protein [Chondromyces apiculatus]EYF00653.1 Hypothetical protein CAP_0406 [Chondromyces apiculatus DSM 436]
MNVLIPFGMAAQFMSYEPSPAQGKLARTMSSIEERVFVDQHALLPVPPPLDVLQAPIAQFVSRRWKEPCEAMFEFLAVQHPASLLRLIEQGKLDAADLTFAAELAGRLKHSEAVRRTLLPLLAHPRAVVREGAIYGLSNHLDEASRERLAELVEKDQSPAVRAAAADALDEP